MSRAELRRGAGRRVAMASVGLVLIGLPRAARAQTSWLLQGIADGEAWSTNASSNLLTRNGGKPGVVGRLDLWTAAEPLPKLVLYAQGEAEGGPARAPTNDPTVQAEMFGVRYAGSPAFVVDAGRLTPLVGTFAARRFSTRNPLIGTPDGYSLEYPYGVTVSGEGRHLDYRAGLVSLPVSHDGYQPEPTARARPAVGVGVTPLVGFRIGASYTAGSYLNDALPASLLAGRSWTDYQQHVLAGDLAFSRGYLETHAEIARGTFEVPNHGTLVGLTYYGEAKYTLTPRLFVATRVERNDYPFIRPLPPSTWIAKLTDFVDGEVGVGYRVSVNTLLKVSVRADRWWVKSGQGLAGTGGHAFAVQWSQAFDVLGWVERARE